MKYIRKFENNEADQYNSENFIPFIEWYYKSFGDKMEKEGWAIFYNTYGIDRVDKDFFQVQKINYQNIIKNDDEACELAKKSGLMLKDFQGLKRRENRARASAYGIVIGYNGVNFMEHPEELEIYKDIKKYNL